MGMLDKDQVRHFRLSTRAYKELKIRSAKQGKPVGIIISELLWPKK